MELVAHPGAALMVPFLDANTIIILRQYRPVIRQFLYELPAGTLHQGESLLSCAKREIIEETGYATGKLTRLGAIFPVPGYSTEQITFFKAERLRKVQAATEADEVITTCIATRAQVRQWMRRGQLQDAKTICALAFCNWL